MMIFLTALCTCASHMIKQGAPICALLIPEKNESCIGLVIQTVDNVDSFKVSHARFHRLKKRQCIC